MSAPFFVRLETAEHRLDPGYQLLGIKGFDHIIVRTQLQSQDLVENLALGGKHDDGDVGALADFPTDLVAVHAGKHQVEKDQVRGEGVEAPKSRLAVANDPGVETFFGEIEGDELCDIAVIVHNHDFLFCCHFPAPRFTS